MQVIGITGGVGAGKSAILEYLEQNYRVKNLIADKIAKRLMEPGRDRKSTRLNSSHWS